MNQAAQRIAFLDYFRGIAILSVFLFHAVGVAFHYGMLPWNGWFRSFSVPTSFIVLIPFNIGWIGVPIFFVISGFCIHMSFEREGRDWGNFYIRRLFRIYPAYLGALLLFALFFYSDTNHDLSLQLKNHLLLIHNFDRRTFSGINAAFWTIAIEAQLYLMYPLLLTLVEKIGWKSTLIALAICEALIHGWDAALQSFLGAQAVIGCRMPSIFLKASPISDFLFASPLAYWFSWSIGAFTADAFLRARPMSFAQCSAPLFGVLVIVSYFARPLSPFFFLFSAVLTATVISKCLSEFRPGLRVPQFCLEHLRRTGVYSYSIYLLHLPLLYMVGKLTSRIFSGVSIHPPLVFLICVASWAVIMPLGYLWYCTIEKPGIAFGKRVIQNMADPGKTSSAPKREGEGG